MRFHAPTSSSLRFALRAVPISVALLGLVACAGGDDQPDLQEASAEVERVERDVEAARDRVAQRQEAVQEANVALEEAQRELAEIEAELSNARESVENAISDADLFRGVQSALLEDPSFQDLAISARVAQRVVTLEGLVPNETLKQTAEEIAAGTLGVATVVNQIRVETPEAP